MNRTQFSTLCAAAILVATSQAAQAHVGVGHASGLADGFAHPIGGLDHILAMIMAGVVAAQIGGRAVWLVPASFVTVMVLGGLIGVVGVRLPFLELGIGLSVVVLGAVVAFGLRIAVPLAMAMVGFFAMFHGFAHGVEMPTTGSGLGYGAGFVLATVALQAFGVGFGTLLSRVAFANDGHLVRAAGGVAALAGVGMVTGLI